MIHSLLTGLRTVVDPLRNVGLLSSPPGRSNLWMHSGMRRGAPPGRQAGRRFRRTGGSGLPIPPIRRDCGPPRAACGRGGSTRCADHPNGSVKGDVRGLPASPFVYAASRRRRTSSCNTGRTSASNQGCFCIQSRLRQAGCGRAARDPTPARWRLTASVMLNFGPAGR